MELKSYRSYIDKLVVDNFDYDTFSPENSKNLFGLFKTIFYCDTPYWKTLTTEGEHFYIEFKKYGENRKRVFLKFSFKSRLFILTLTDEEFNEVDKKTELYFSEIWKDHEQLAKHLKDNIEKGLKIAAETN